MPPVNNNFASATVISGLSGTLTTSNVDATKESGEPNHAGNSGGTSIWFRWTAPSSVTMSVDTYGSDVDTLLGVYTGSSVAALSEITSNDDSVGYQSRVVFSAESGTTYQIAIDGWGGDFGSITLTWAELAAPSFLQPNDNLTELVAGAPLSVALEDADGYVDGTGEEARFSYPKSLSAWGNVLVTMDAGIGINGGLSPIRLVTSRGVVTTHATVPVPEYPEYGFDFSAARDVVPISANTLWATTIFVWDTPGGHQMHLWQVVSGEATLLWSRFGYEETPWPVRPSGLEFDPVRGGVWCVEEFGSGLWHLTEDGPELVLNFPNDIVPPYTGPDLRYPSSTAILNTQAGNFVATGFAHQTSFSHPDYSGGLYYADPDTAVMTQTAAMVTGQPSAVVVQEGVAVWVMADAREIDGYPAPAGWWRYDIATGERLLYPWTNDRWSFYSGAILGNYLYWTLDHRVFRHQLPGGGACPPRLAAVCRVGPERVRAH